MIIESQDWKGPKNHLTTETASQTTEDMGVLGGHF